MFLLLITVIILALVTYFFLKPLIDNLFYSVPDEPKYIHSYMPFIGFGLEMFKDPIVFLRSLYLKYGKTFVIRLASKRWVYFYDEQTYLTKVLKSPDLSIDEFLADLQVYGLNVSRQCVTDEHILQENLKQYHQYLSGNELEILNKSVHDSLIESMKLDAKTLQDNQTKVANLFDHFGEVMLYAGTEGLYGHSFATEQRNASPDYYKLFQDFDKAFALGVIHVPFRSILYKSVFRNRLEFVKRFSSLKLNNGESNLIHAREELFRSDKFKHLCTNYDCGALQASMLWAAVANTAPMACWSLVDLLLHPEALDAVKQELKENIPTITLIYEKETLAKLKILESCINESLRHISNFASTRQAMTNTTVECLDKTKIGLRKGDMLSYPAFIKHFDPNIFGPNPYEYQYDRFVKKVNQPKAPSVMFFGCGTHMCPGRFWAVNEIKMLVALIIQHMDIEFVNMTEQDKEDFCRKLPYDYSKFVSSGGPKKGYEQKFDIKYSYKNLDIE
jgi:oxysterol 7-alpha-hydroxylase